MPRIATKYASIAKRMRDRPGTWYPVEDYTGQASKAYALAQNLNRDFYPHLPAHEFEFMSRRGIVYARYIGDGAESAP